MDLKTLQSFRSQCHEGKRELHTSVTPDFLGAFHAGDRRNSKRSPPQQGTHSLRQATCIRESECCRYFTMQITITLNDDEQTLITAALNEFVAQRDRKLLGVEREDTTGMQAAMFNIIHDAEELPKKIDALADTGGT